MNKIIKYLLSSFIIILILINQSCDNNNKENYDLVINNGRVIDPESGLDAVRNIGIKGGSVSMITENVISGALTIDAAGLVVAPGFIDLHQHGQDPENYRYKVMDGVTTALELEMGTNDVDSWYAAREGKTLINFGVSSGHVPLRMKIMNDPGGFAPVADAVSRKATPEEIEQLEKGIEFGLKRGALGVGFGLMYTPAASRLEILNMFRVAGKFEAPCYVHIRYGGLKEPDCINALQEVIAASAVSGAPLHIVHITSIGFSMTPEMLNMIKDARSHGLDVTVECYPYTATQTTIESAVYNEGWQESFGITYHDLQWAETGERLTEASFSGYRKSGGMVIAHSIPENVVSSTVRDSIVIIASDGMITNGKGHPRGAGTFSRILGKFVRDEKVLTLTQGLKKITLMPANRLEAIAPGMKKKGRINIGSDADITIFDPSIVSDRATYDDPSKFSIGIRYVIVNGSVVVDKGTISEDRFPGLPVRGNVN